jgi:hypothetical protein
MNARTLSTATLLTFAGVLGARAADSQLLSMVMPDAKVLAGVNVDSAKASPFGLYVLTQLQSNNTGLQELIALTGFDPTRDVHEVLAATDATPGSKGPSGLVLARGNFDAATITALATSKGAVTETYGAAGVTIIEDPNKVGGIAFLDPTLVIAGDVANVKGAIDRPSSGQSLPSGVLTQVGHWSGLEDAWVITTVPLGSLVPQAAAGTAAASPNPMAGVLQQVLQMGGGVKFGNSVVGTAAILADNAADATQLANTIQFLVNLAQMQSQNNAQLTSLAQGFSVNAQGTTVNITVTLPAAQFQQLFQMEKKAAVGTPHVGRGR